MRLPPASSLGQPKAEKPSHKNSVKAFLKPYNLVAPAKQAPQMMGKAIVRDLLLSPGGRKQFTFNQTEMAVYTLDDSFILNY